MAIKIPNNLPAKGILENEQIIIIDDNVKDNTTKVEIAILNLMPTKIITETQLLRLLGNTPFDVNITLIYPKTYIPKNTSIDHLKTFYKSFDDVKDKKFHGMIITGAPIEHMEFEDVVYWDELTTIFEWTKSNVNSTLHICWGAQASLYYHYGVPKYPLPEKIFGVFLHQPKVKDENLLKGADDVFYAPHSRHTEIRKKDIEKNKNIRIIAESTESGVYMVASNDGKQIFITGHCEYDPLTLKLEYERDISRGLNIKIPKNYFPSDKVENEPIVKWRSHANLVFYNWLYYYAYARN